MLNPQYICSECGNAHTRTTPYCEMCGAKMQEVEEGQKFGEVEETYIRGDDRPHRKYTIIEV